MSKDNLRDGRLKNWFYLENDLLIYSFMNNRENINNKSRSTPGDKNSSLNNKEYNSIPSNRFYTIKEEITLRFYQTPKALFKNPKYRGLSLGPKLMYSILRDRLDLSIKNNWKDEKEYSPKLNNLQKEEILFEKENNPEDSYFKDNKTAKYPSIKRRSPEKEQLAKEIAEVLEDDHSLGAFRVIVDMISE
jgi:hypothetical protein